MKANASKHKAMSYDRMNKDEAKLRAKVRDLLAAAEAADAQEDAEYGKGKRGDEMPEELRRAESRLARIKQLKAELEAEARQQDKEATKRDDDLPPPPAQTPLPSHKIPRTKDGGIDPKAQRNFTDAASRIMKSGEGYVQAYNCQAVVDEEHQIIVAQAVTNQPLDAEHLVPMLAQTVRNCGAKPKNLLADAGYYSEANIGASVRARLQRLAREQDEDFQLLLTRHANERLLFRLSTSGHAQQFVLKGAALFTLWTGKPHRATRDLDLLGFGDPGVEPVRQVFSEVLAREVADDGVNFDLTTLAVGLIREDQEYGGVRVEVLRA